MSAKVSVTTISLTRGDSLITNPTITDDEIKAAEKTTREKLNGQ